MAEVAGAPQCEGPLSGLAGKFEAAAHACWGAANFVRPIVFLGRIADYFFQLGDRLYEAKRKCKEANCPINDAINAASWALSWDGWRAMLQDRAPTLYGLWYWPHSTIKALFGEALGIEPYHMQNAQFFIKHLIDKYLHSLYALYLDPMGEIVRYVSQYSSFIAGLFINPLKQIRWTAGEFLGLPQGLWDHPDRWLRALMEAHQPWLVELWADPMLYLNKRACERGSPLCGLFVAPDKWVWAYIRKWFGFPFTSYEDLPSGIWDWLLYQYEEHFERFKDGLYSLAEHTIRYFWEGVW